MKKFLANVFAGIERLAKCVFHRQPKPRVRWTGDRWPEDWAERPPKISETLTVACAVPPNSAQIPI